MSSNNNCEEIKQIKSDIRICRGQYDSLWHDLCGIDDMLVQVRSILELAHGYLMDVKLGMEEIRNERIS